MAKPQLENGFTSIANEILEAFIFARLNGAQFKVLLFIIRQTWGWKENKNGPNKKKKKKAAIALTQFEQACNMNRKTITKALGELEEYKMIIRWPAVECINGKWTTVYAFQKDWELWKNLRIKPEKKKSTRGQKTPGTGVKRPLQKPFSRGQKTPIKRKINKVLNKREKGMEKIGDILKDKYKN